MHYIFDGNFRRAKDPSSTCNRDRATLALKPSGLPQVKTHSHCACPSRPYIKKIEGRHKTSNTVRCGIDCVRGESNGRTSSWNEAVELLDIV